MASNGGFRHDETACNSPNLCPNIKINAVCTVYIHVLDDGLGEWVYCTNEATYLEKD